MTPRRLFFTLLPGAALLGAADLALTHHAQLAFPEDDRLYATLPRAYGTNDDGFLERELPASPDPTVRRVAVLGDSMTYGTSTAEDAWPRQSEKILGESWQVLNFAQYGYDVAQSAATLRHHVWAYAPNLVVYAAYANDSVRTRLVYAGEPALPTSVSATRELFPVGLRRRSGVLRTLEGAWLTRRVTYAPNEAFFRESVADMAAQAGARGVPFLVVTLAPHTAAGKSRGSCDARCTEALATTARQTAVLAELGVAHTSVLPALFASGRDSFYASNPEDWEHPSPEGHAVIAAAMAEVLAESLGRPSAPAHAPP